MRVLVVGPAWVGDMVMAQTLFKLLKQTNNALELDVVAPPSTLALLARMPEVRQTIRLEAGHGGLQLRTRHALGASLRARYDWAIVLPNSWKSALVPFFAAIPKRTGWRGEWRYGLLNDIRILDEKKYPLMIERFCALGLPEQQGLPNALSFPVLEIDTGNQTRLKERFQLSSGKKILVMCPGAEYGPSKRWPPEYFAEVAKVTVQEGGEVWLLGGPKDAEVAEEIQKHCQHVCQNFVAKTSLLDAIDLLAMASVVLTNDSGLMHIAAAVGARIVAVYGSTSPGFTPPLTDKAEILSLKLDCSPCFQRTCRFGHYHCLTELKPAQVLAVLKTLS